MKPRHGTLAGPERPCCAMSSCRKCAGGMDLCAAASYFRAPPVSADCARPMSAPPLDPNMTCVVCENAFKPAELDRIIAIGDGLTLREATLAGPGWEGEGKAGMRITRTAWITNTPD